MSAATEYAYSDSQRNKGKKKLKQLESQRVEKG